MDSPCGRWGKGTQDGSELERREGDAENLQGHGAKPKTCPGVRWQEGQWVQADWAAPGFAVMGKHAISGRPNYEELYRSA